MKRVIAALPNAMWIALALATLLAMIAAAYVGAADAPVADEWRYVDPAIYLQNLFEKNNGHPLVIGRIGLALDYWLFDARGWALRALSFAFTAATIGAALVIAWLAGCRTLASQIAIGALACALLFNPQGVQNFAIGFQFTFLLAFAATAGAIATLAAYATDAKPLRLALAYALSAIAVLSLGNGIVTPFLLALMAWRLGLNPRVTLGFAALGAISAIGVALAPEIGAANERLPMAPLFDSAIYALRVLGSGPGLTLAALTGADALIMALLFGLAGVAGALWFAWHAARAPEPNAGRLGAVMLMLFAIASAAAIAVVRAAGDAQAALASRYVVVSSIFLVGLALAAWPTTFTRTWRTYALTALALAVLATIPAAAPSVVQHGEENQREFVRAESALVVGLMRPGALAALAPLDLISANTEVLRANGKWLFQDRWSRSLGERLDVEHVTATCGGTLRVLAQRTGTPHLVRVRGAITSVSPGRIIVIADASGTMVGYGLRLRRAADLLPFLDKPGAQAEWLGMARTQDGGAYTAYVASPTALLCRIGAARSDSRLNQLDRTSEPRSTE
jgi:hypothetical protein